MVLVMDLGAVGSASYQTRSVRAIAERHSGLKIVVCHLGQPNPNAEADPRLWKFWEEQIDLGRMPNVWFDTAALPAYLEKEGYPYPSAARYLRIAMERIGPARLLWGSDMPGLLAHATYAQLLDVVRAHTDFLSADDRSLVLGKNAAAVFGLDLA